MTDKINVAELRKSFGDDICGPKFVQDAIMLALLDVVEAAPPALALLTDEGKVVNKLDNAVDKFDFGGSHD